ncbi:hypothetical protein ACH5RR_009703 [Cinchona calisaya]|uniref:FAF domain-containing protein n=1 Tax=Cinchona calisaya TaxID=153742 RepID=A0ABD3AH58_9GENT
MAACGGLQQIFEKPLPENATLLESLSPWKQIKNMKPIEDSSSFTEIFGELHFKENKVYVEPSSTTSSFLSSSSSLLVDINEKSGIERTNYQVERSKSHPSSYYPFSQKKQYKHSDSFSSMNSDSLSLCTEGLGVESYDDVEDLGNETSFDFSQQQLDQEKNTCFTRQHAQYNYDQNICKEYKRSRTSKWSFPPPISCIGRTTGKPWVTFKSHRQDGRFILQEIRFPTQEFLHACREDGRLRLQFIQSDDEILEEGEGDDDDDDSENLINKEKDGDDYDDKHKHQQNRKIEENDAEKNVQDS